MPSIMMEVPARPSAKLGGVMATAFDTGIAQVSELQRERLLFQLSLPEVLEGKIAWAACRCARLGSTMNAFPCGVA